MVSTKLNSINPNNNKNNTSKTKQSHRRSSNDSLDTLSLPPPPPLSSSSSSTTPPSEPSTPTTTLPSTATSNGALTGDHPGGIGISHRGPFLSSRPVTVRTPSTLPLPPTAGPGLTKTFTSETESSFHGGSGYESGLKKVRKPTMSAFSSPIPFTRRFVFLGIIIATVIFVVTSRSDSLSSSPVHPKSWFSSTSGAGLDAQIYNDASLTNLSPKEKKLAIAQAQYNDKLAPYFNPSPNWGGQAHGRDDYKAYTEKKMRDLAVCIATNTCRENQTSVIIYGHIFQHFHLYEGYMGGEGIWTGSLTETLNKWGYTILHARDDWPYIWHIHNQIPDMVKGIIAWKSGQYGGFADFIKTGWRGNGIPAWKFFVYNYFPDHYNSVVGDAWNIHSEFGYSAVQRNFTFMPYIVESPATPPYIPTVERPNQIYILAKFVRYFYPGTQPAWDDHTFYSRAKAELEQEFPGFEFVVGCRDDRNGKEQEEHPMSVPEGIRNLGVMDKVEFERQLANSRGMLGIGWPTLSPSPHIALSYGIPFISPYGVYDWSSPDKPETWSQSQHDTLKALSDPYVYHVQRNNYTQFVSAIRSALSTPIPQFRLPYMTREFHEKAVGEWLSTDWKAKAIGILENRKNKIETENGNVIQEFGI
ncbi:hypothetical protein CI109_104317 [Kwoniella shandongensis]|uniref:Glycosyltransferase family 18 catalytic domain-containing protein n=1 Tax=Kwoniella shandongensis TaxID=1734106 RepID=A0A5M6C2J8_9TREE|nr:uncharacterized protein CI109_004287 [Kwoniella shandongensis]KAA5527469.1 hypothetical protein CI109_004287 [Kwoniella shandongensis]